MKVASGPAFWKTGPSDFERHKKATAPGSHGPTQMTDFRATLKEALALKGLPRAGWIRAGVRDPESVAAHSWGVGWLVLVLCPPHLDRERALAMAILHDLPEVRTGDITPHDGVPTEEKQLAESRAMRSLVASLEEGDYFLELWWEYENGSSPEGRLVKACDKLDMALQAQRYAGEQALDLDEFIDSALARLDEASHRNLVTG